MAHRADWRGGTLQIAYLVTSPLRPFLEAQQYADFRDHNEAQYGKGLPRDSSAALLGRPDRRDPARSGTTLYGAILKWALTSLRISSETLQRSLLASEVRASISSLWR